MPDPTSTLTPAALPQRAGGLHAVPSQFPLTGDEKLRVTTYNSLVGVNVVVHGRMLDATGTFTPFRFVTTPNTDRSAKTDDFPLKKGVIIGLVAFVEGATPFVGQTFVQVRVVLGQQGATFLVGTLLQGYTTAFSELAWPGSPVQSSVDGGGYTRLVQGTNPGAGNNVVETCPTNARWELVSFKANFGTSAVVAARTPRLFIRDPTLGVTSIMGMPASVPANSAYFLTWGQGLANAQSAEPTSPTQAVAGGITLTAGQTINIDAINIQAGDTLTSPVYSVLESIVP